MRNLFIAAIAAVSFAAVAAPASAQSTVVQGRAIAFVLEHEFGADYDDVPSFRRRAFLQDDD